METEIFSVWFLYFKYKALQLNGFNLFSVNAGGVQVFHDLHYAVYKLYIYKILYVSILLSISFMWLFVCIRVVNSVLYLYMYCVPMYMYNMCLLAGEGRAAGGTGRVCSPARSLSHRCLREIWGETVSHLIESALNTTTCDR